MKNRKNKLYAAYGSNLNLKQMAIRCPYATVIGNGMLRDYRLLFRGGYGSAVATVEPKKGAGVPVLLWEITPRCEDALDRYEGWPRLYRKETLGVSYDGKIVEATAYLMNEGYGLAIPGSAYLNTIVEGYFTADFDTAVLEKALRDSRPRGRKPQKP